MSILGGVIGAVATVAGGIFGSSNADKQNKAAKRAEKEQKRHAKQVAKATNKYNKKLDEADKANYIAMREYSHETNMKNWNYGRQIKDFEYANRLQQYQKSQAITGARLGLADLGRAQAIESSKAVVDEAFFESQLQHKNNMSALKQTYAEQALNRKEENVRLLGIRTAQDFRGRSLQNSINQLMTTGALEKESLMVEAIVAEGTTQAAMQAGKSKAKANQATMASLQRGLMTLESELSGKHKQAALQLAELNATSDLDAIGVGINLEKIDLAIDQAEETAEYNQEVIAANMKSVIGQTERDLKQSMLEDMVNRVNIREQQMLPPQRVPYAPEPEMPPERIFVKRMKAIPGFVPPAQQANVWAPLINSGFSAAGQLASIDWGAGSSGKQQGMKG